MKQASLLLIAAALLICAPVVATHAEQGAPAPLSVPPAPGDRELEALKAAVSPTSPATSRALIEGYLERKMYIEAFDATQTLRAQIPDQPEDLLLLGRACFGLGLFDEAAATYYSVLQKEPSNGGAAWWLSYLLIMRGDVVDGKKLAAEWGRRTGDWSYYELQLGATPNPAKQAAILAEFLEKHPDDARAKAAMTQLETTLAGQGPGRMTAGEGQVISTRISDRYRVKVELNGHKAMLLFDPCTSGMTITDDLAATLKMTASSRTRLLDAAGRVSLLEARVATLAEFKIGGASLADVEARVEPQLAWHDLDGVFGPDVLPGAWAYRIDRKGELLEFFPPGTPVPTPSTAGAASQRYYQIGRTLLVPTAVTNKETQVTTKAMMFLSLGSEVSFYDLDYAKQLNWGQIVTTASTTITSGARYGKAVLVRFSELTVGGLRFDMPKALATDMGNIGRFAPYGLLSWDVMSRFRLTIDPATHQIIFEPY